MGDLQKVYVLLGSNPDLTNCISRRDRGDARKKASSEARMEFVKWLQSVDVDFSDEQHLTPKAGAESATPLFVLETKTDIATTLMSDQKPNIVGKAYEYVEVDFESR